MRRRGTIRPSTFDWAVWPFLLSRSSLWLPRNPRRSASLDRAERLSEVRWFSVIRGWRLVDDVISIRRLSSRFRSGGLHQSPCDERRQSEGDGRKGATQGDKPETVPNCGWPDKTSRLFGEAASYECANSRGNQPVSESS